MRLEALDQHLGDHVTRRRIVKTGVKLAYAAPLVAASFQLTAGGTLARTCTCGCTLFGPWVYDPSTGTCKSDNPNRPPDVTCPPTCVS
jgi:hypothetical protein